MTIIGVALGAGLGMRLQPFTEWRPKPLLPILGHPVIEHVIRALERAGADEVLVNLHHRPEPAAAYLNARRGAVPVHYAKEPRLRGPAGALLTFADRLRDAVDVILVGSGDILFSDELTGLIKTHRTTGASLTFATRRTRGASRYGVLDISGEGLVLRSREKPNVPDEEEHTVSGGIYCLDPAVLEEIASLTTARGTCDFARELAPALLERGDTVATAPLFGYWRDIGSPKALYRANLDAVTGAVGPNIAEGVTLWCENGEPVPVYVHPRAVIGRDVRFLGPSAICGHADIGDGCRLGDVVLLNRTVVARGTAIVGGLVGALSNGTKDTSLEGSL